jgi:hypothetical protein
MALLPNGPDSYICTNCGGQINAKFAHLHPAHCRDTNQEQISNPSSEVVYPDNDGPSNPMFG